MKKTILTALSLSFLLGMAGNVDYASAAALPKEGTYLNKDGTLPSEEEKTPLQVLSMDLEYDSPDIEKELQNLPHSVTAIVRLTVDRDGFPADSTITKSTGDPVLDDFILKGVLNWRFIPAKVGNTPIASQAQAPITFISLKVNTPAYATEKPMRLDASEALEEISNFSSRFPSGIDVPIHVRILDSGLTDPDWDDFSTWDNSSLTPKEKRILLKYAAKSILDWKFVPAKNPDGQDIPSDQIVVVHVADDD